MPKAKAGATGIELKQITNKLSYIYLYFKVEPWGDESDKTLSIFIKFKCIKIYF